MPGASTRRMRRARARERGPGGATTIRGKRSPRPSAPPAGTGDAIEGAAASDLAAAGEGAAQSDLVGVLDVAADRHAERQAGDGETARLEHAGEVERRRLALDVRVGREHHLAHAVEELEQTRDRELVGSHAAMRRE